MDRSNDQKEMVESSQFRREGNSYPEIWKRMTSDAITELLISILITML